MLSIFASQIFCKKVLVKKVLYIYKSSRFEHQFGKCIQPPDSLKIVRNSINCCGTSVWKMSILEILFAEFLHSAETLENSSQSWELNALCNIGNVLFLQHNFFSTPTIVKEYINFGPFNRPKPANRARLTRKSQLGF